MSGELSVTRKNSPTFRTGFGEAETDRLCPPLPTASFPLPIRTKKAKYHIPIKIIQLLVICSYMMIDDTAINSAHKIPNCKQSKAKSWIYRNYDVN